MTTRPNEQGAVTGNALGIFAKEPLPGLVKTRLCPPLTPEQAALLYRESLMETVEAVVAHVPAEPVLFYEGDEGFFKTCFPRLKCIPQRAGDLGQRMSQAFAYLFAAGCRTAALIGSDSPDLPPALITEALVYLERTDLVAIPAVDGGYVLIGTRQHRPQLFLDIPWSTSGVWPATRQRADALGLSWRLVEQWFDLDRSADLLLLIHRSPSSRTARLARRLLNSVPDEDSFSGMTVDLPGGDDR
ncbi:MAG: TIGR04282 family arsenosugar biosynthesis glycosyltransferase [Syntrophotaleaceae bacterium]